MQAPFVPRAQRCTEVWDCKLGGDRSDEGLPQLCFARGGWLPRQAALSKICVDLEEAVQASLREDRDRSADCRSVG